MLSEFESNSADESQIREPLLNIASSMRLLKQAQKESKGVYGQQGNESKIMRLLEDAGRFEEARRLLDSSDWPVYRKAAGLADLVLKMKNAGQDGQELVKSIRRHFKEMRAIEKAQIVKEGEADEDEDEENAETPDPAYKQKRIECCIEVVPYLIGAQFHEDASKIAQKNLKEKRYLEQVVKAAFSMGFFNETIEFIKNPPYTRLDRAQVFIDLFRDSTKGKSNERFFTAALKELDYGMDSKPQSYTDHYFKQLTLILASQKRFDEAEKFINQISSRDHREDCWKDIAPLMAAAGDVTRAQSIIQNNISDKAWQTDAYFKMATHFAEQGDAKRAMKVVQLLCKSPQGRTQALLHIAYQSSDAAASALFQIAKQEVLQIHDKEDRERLMEQMQTKEQELERKKHVKKDEPVKQKTSVETRSSQQLRMTDHVTKQSKNYTERLIQAAGTLLQRSSSKQEGEDQNGIAQINSLSQADWQQIIQVAVTQNDEELIAAVGTFFQTQDRAFLIANLDQTQRAHVTALLDHGRSWMPMLTAKELTPINTHVRSRLTEIMKPAPNQENIADVRHESKILCTTLLQLSSKDANDIILQTARSLSKEIANPIFTRIIHTLLESNTPKGNDLGLQIVGNENLPSHLAWLYLRKLVANGYLNEDFLKYLRANIGDWEEEPTTQEIVELEREDLNLIRLIINRLHIPPDLHVIRLIRNWEWKDDQEEIDNRKHPEVVIGHILEMASHFEKMSDRDELVEYLAEDTDRAAAYYLMHGGAVKFSLTNQYRAGHFINMLARVDKLNYHNVPLEQWQQALTKKNMNEEQVSTIVSRLKAGQFPLEGESAWRVRLDVSDTEVLKVLEREAAGLLGKNQLGALLKYSLYHQWLLDGKDVENAASIEAVNGLAELESVIAKIEHQYPEYITLAEQHYVRDWKKNSLGNPQAFNFSLSNVLQETAYPIRLEEILGKSSHLCKAFLHSTKQRLKMQMAKGTLTKDEYQAQLKELEQEVESPEGFIACLAKELNSSIPAQLSSEWESHIESVFGRYNALLHEDAGEGRQKRVVTLRYLDKRKDLIAALRFADGAQCCFTSEHHDDDMPEDEYDEDYEENDGTAKWIARIWKDPLSFVFLIEDNEIDASKRDAIGFVFGSFGLNEKKEPVTLLNGVYLERQKTDTAVQSILKTIERQFSQRLGAEEQFVASRHGGTAYLGGEYDNKTRQVLRLRALGTSRYFGDELEKESYDDLNLKPNTVSRTDDEVWHKRIASND